MFGVTKGLRPRGFVDLRRKRHHVGQSFASGGTDFLLLFTAALTSLFSHPLSAAPCPSTHGIPGMTTETRVDSRRLALGSSIPRGVEPCACYSTGAWKLLERLYYEAIGPSGL